MDLGDDGGDIPVVMTVAGSDSCGGAGLQADLKTFFSLGCHGTTAVTCVTAQSTAGVKGIMSMEPGFVSLQMRTVFEDCRVRAVKTGMLHTAQCIREVAEVLRDYCDLPENKTADKAQRKTWITSVVVDPVMVASSGDSLTADQAKMIETLKEALFPLASVITPNIPEAETLLGWEAESIRSPSDMERAARELCEKHGCRACLVKGGHLALNLHSASAASATVSSVSGSEQNGGCPSEIVDVLFDSKSGELARIALPTIMPSGAAGGKSKRGDSAEGLAGGIAAVHGTGCSLASALTAYLVRSFDLFEAAHLAKEYVHTAIENAYELGEKSLGLEHGSVPGAAAAIMSAEISGVVGEEEKIEVD
uniref:Pyridoxamine kinase/Phosphomethylpyrimidine kinase domain-containing protein n=1 Tax=Chromera velia CCMP2878 TaxID=1169474 RepID=A0A0G4FT50_9ALVE|eukprot:Cvel_18548.t1-p1 / transcript=Cvel_18548.t1 / gene=Cvel_18548 / organism=Chromera_velia_CCMP2878 / gene_product=Thiamine biosynthesis bifunctional protein ThiED, putative / transcript_product=Thiamine biosynthesis bifunctional protein ThiED, putative / location=Cvel_scaffold1544:29069-31703(-) / protein_length=363 / sequence_SO=supercontig / SO=protein_coding / is_pseudo=false